MHSEFRQVRVRVQIESALGSGTHSGSENGFRAEPGSGFGPGTRSFSIQRRYMRPQPAVLLSYKYQLSLGWLGSRVVSALDSGAEGPGFKSQPRRCRVTVLGKLFAPIVPLFTKQQNW